MAHQQMGLDLLHGLKSYANHNQAVPVPPKKRRFEGYSWSMQLPRVKGKHSNDRQEDGTWQCDSE
jgi:hypothetical protein